MNVVGEKVSFVLPTGSITDEAVITQRFPDGTAEVDTNYGTFRAETVVLFQPVPKERLTDGGGNFQHVLQFDTGVNLTSGSGATNKTGLGKVPHLTPRTSEAANESIHGVVTPQSQNLPGIALGKVEEVNNEFLRAAGDDALRQAVNILRTAMQAYDFIGEYVRGESLISSSKRRFDAILDQIEAQLSAAKTSLPRGTLRQPIRIATVEKSDPTPENSKALLARLEQNLATGCSPRPKAAEAASSQPAAPTKADPAKPLLIMGRDPLQRADLARRVAALGYSVVEAGSAEDAWNILRGPEQVGALLLDMRTSEAGELDFVEDLRTDPTFSGLDVVVAAARPVQGTVSRALSLNVSSLVSKPVDIVKLSEILTPLLRA